MSHKNLYKVVSQFLFGENIIIKKKTSYHRKYYVGTYSFIIFIVNDFCFCFITGIWHNRYYPISSMISTANRSSAHDLFITGDTDGYLRLFRYTKQNIFYIFILCALKSLNSSLNLLGPF